MSMVEIKTAELEGAALDWAVALADGRDMGLYIPCGQSVQICGMWSNGCTWSPSTIWAQGGPLVEKHAVGFGFFGDEWQASEGEHAGGCGSVEKGPTHLIAACRAIVAAKLGDTVSVPAELVAK